MSDVASVTFLGFTPRHSAAIDRTRPNFRSRHDNCTRIEGLLGKSFASVLCQIERQHAFVVHWTFKDLRMTQGCTVS
jgi:hypothetical protein